MTATSTVRCHRRRVPASAGGGRAQNLAQRIASAPDGAVQFTFAARPGVCGNGRSYYSINGSMWFGSVNDNTMRSDPCQPGPVRVVLGRAGKEIVDVNVFVGPVQPSSGRDGPRRGSCARRGGLPAVARGHASTAVRAAMRSRRRCSPTARR